MNPGEPDDSTKHSTDRAVREYEFGTFRLIPQPHNAIQPARLLKDGEEVTALRTYRRTSRLLIYLVERREKAVPIEELITELWPKESPVDQKGSLTDVIQKLRFALDEDHPHAYIERANSEVQFVYRPVVIHYEEDHPVRRGGMSTLESPAGTKFGDPDVTANHRPQKNDVTIDLATADEPRVEPTTQLGFADLLRGLHPISPEIKAFGERHGTTPIDQYIQLRSSPAWLGWPQNRVATFPDVEEHQPLPELQNLMDRFPPIPPINLLYSLQSWSCDLTKDDEIEKAEEIPYLYLSATGGSWRHIFALQAAWRRATATDPEQPPDEECSAFHRKFEQDLSELITKKRSRLYCNANTEVILLTQDHQIVLARRSGSTQFSHGLWSASFEEQVLRLRKRDNKSDHGDLFSCAHRGAFEEFGVTIIPEASRLLAMGVEWGNFTLAFIVLLRCHENYDEIRNWSWEHVAGDPTEAVAIDCMDTENEEDIKRSFLLEEWIPSHRAKRSNLLPEDAPDPLQPSKWHPVARARLLAYLLHKDSSR